MQPSQMQPSRDEPFTDGYGPMARWERDREQPDTLAEITQRISEGETLKAVCKSRGWPYSQVGLWVNGDDNRKKQYEAAVALWVDMLAMETVAISDEQAEVVKEDGTAFDPNVPRDALRIKARQWAAEKLNRERYGQMMRVERSVNLTADAGLVGFAGELLARLKPGAVREEKVVEAQPVEAEPLPGAAGNAYDLLEGGV